MQAPIGSHPFLQRYHYDVITKIISLPWRYYGMPEILNQIRIGSSDPWCWRLLFLNGRDRFRQACRFRQAM